MKDLSQSSGQPTPGSSSSTSSELWPVGVKLGIVRLGRAAGKLKYTLLDEQDIVLAREYSFEARLEVDRDGNGAVIFANAFSNGRRSQARHLQDVIWESHFGRIPDSMRVVHKNHISMDNRRDNLQLVLRSDSYNWYNSLWRTSKAHDQHLSLYYCAIQQLPPEHTFDPFGDRSKCYDSNGDPIDEDDDSNYYECHYPACVRIEKEPRQFSICGRCQETRYCGTSCQQRDWPYHKRFCREKKRDSGQTDRLPER